VVTDEAGALQPKRLAIAVHHVRDGDVASGRRGVFGTRGGHVEVEEILGKSRIGFTKESDRFPPHVSVVVGIP
jgi:hypothetical protein